MQPDVAAFFDEATFTITYVVREPSGPHCAIVDPVLDYEANSGRTSTKSADRIVAHVSDDGLVVDHILETHVHADHLTAAAYLQGKLGGKIGIGDQVTTVQETFRNLFNAEPSFAADGSQFDELLGDGATFSIGSRQGRVVHTPGHTPACSTYVIGDAAFVGDTLFMPDFGTARCDFPGGDARTLYRSIKKILSLPEETRLFMCHDYAPGGRPIRWQTTVAEQRARNIHVHDAISEEEFVRLRTERDKTLELPALLFPSIQVNMRAGNLPPPDENGICYLRVPVNAL